MNVEGTTVPKREEQALEGSAPLAFLQRMRERYGDVFELRVGGERLVVVSDPDLIKQIFHAPPDVLHAGGDNRVGLSRLFGEHSLPLLDDVRHVERRRLLLPAFTGARMEAHAEAMREVAEAELAGWPLGEPIATLPRLRELTLAVVMRAVFGDGAGSCLAALERALLELHMPSGRVADEETCRRAVDRARVLITEEVAARRAVGSLPVADGMISLLLGARYEDGSPLSEVE